MSLPLVIAHAAAAGEAPANTLAGVRIALDRVDAMEIDVRLCADGVPVLLHDETLDRTTNLAGPAREATLAQLRTADAGGGERVPALDEVLELVDGRITVMCELKVPPGGRGEARTLLEATLAVVSEYRAEAGAALHSFDHDLVVEAQSLAPAITTATISLPLDPAGVGALCDRVADAGIAGVSLQHSSVGAEAMSFARARGLQLWAWTADTPADWQRLTDVGVDGTITNLPTALRAWGRVTPGPDR